MTLKTESGREVSFTAPPEARNLDQLKVGDKVNATVNSQMIIAVGEGGEAGARTAGAVMRAPEGAKPGAIVAQAFELVAKVTKIDTETRKATLEFADGSTRVVPVRKDVDLSKYKVGDSVTIRVMQQLALIAQAP